ncbi:hypothetical protein F5X98DRAFT_96117 [Xylaria grammica]|nr:hypothetical protein F5X98DRAFT_96117 [Xylaria grammica]
MDSEGVAVGWQSSPGRRGTLTIIENCLFTIIACTWSIQHPNVPGLGEAGWRTLIRKCKWTVFTLFFPEFLMAHAILEFVMAVENMKSLDILGHLHDSLPWFYRRVRRHPLNSDDMETGRVKSASVPGGAGQSEVKWTLTHCYFANMGGFYIRDDDQPSSTPTDHLLTASHFVKHWTHINIPNLSEDDLNDKSKTDYFTKAIAVIQITQLILSLIIREVQHLAFSQLETLTLAFAVCGILTYICSWYKPQNVRKPIEVSFNKDSDKLKPEILQRRTFDSFWHVLANSKVAYRHRALQRIPNDNIPKSNPQEAHYALYVLTVLTAAFGSIHAVAWNFEFPTSVEQTLWRISTLISTALPPVTLLTIPLAQILRSWGDSASFRYTCLDIMREYSWDVADNRPVQDAMKILKRICDDPEGVKHEHYREIFGDHIVSEDFLGERLLAYIEQNQELRRSLPRDFLPKFTKLVEILRGTSGSKRLLDTARTNTYPKRSLFNSSLNNAIIYLSGIVYCIARLSIIGISFSSLRQMPGSVYVTPWTQYIPSVQ